MNTQPRDNRTSWHDTNMLRAIVASFRSLDPSSQVGAYLATSDQRPLGSGYNGFPKGVNKDAFPWDRLGNLLETKYPYIVHAEKNAIANATGDTRGSTMYVTMHPCNECMKDIIQAGVTKVYYLTNPYSTRDFTIAAIYLAACTGVQLKEFKWDSLENVKANLEKLQGYLPA